VVGEQLKLLRRHFGISQTAIAKILGIKQTAVSAWEGGRNEPTTPTLLKIANTYGVSADWLLTGQGPMLREERFEAAPVRRATMDPDADPPRLLPGPMYESLDPDRYCQVRRYSAYVEGGPGVEVPDVEELEPLVFQRSWMRRRRLNPAKCAVLSVVGDNMEPTVCDGDSVLIDERDICVERDGLYVVAFGGDLRVKRLQRKGNGGLRVISDNPRYPLEEFPPDRLGEVRSLGRVVWCGREF
jgi:phage repressor protein C with HTH and peptisase S24 domain